MDWELIKNVILFIGGFIGLLTFIKGILEYSHQIKQKRVIQFIEMRRRFKENEKFRQICDLCEIDNDKLIDIPLGDRRNYAGFLEEVALMMNSGLIRKNVVFYFFGWYALTCWHSKNFWVDMGQESNYWDLFRDFAHQMEEIEKSFQYRRSDFEI